VLLVVTAADALGAVAAGRPGIVALRTSLRRAALCGTAVGIGARADDTGWGTRAPNPAAGDGDGVSAIAGGKAPRYGSGG
jgi:hypothetical protein